MNFLLIVADAVLIVHVPLVLFAAAGWRWVRSRAFRFAHLAAIGGGVVQTKARTVSPAVVVIAWRPVVPHCKVRCSRSCY